MSGFKHGDQVHYTAFDQEISLAIMRLEVVGDERDGMVPVVATWSTWVPAEKLAKKPSR